MTVPKALHASVGRTLLSRSLKTRDLAEAHARMGVVLAEFTATIEAAYRKLRSNAPLEAGLEWRAALAGLDDGKLLGCLPIYDAALTPAADVGRSRSAVQVAFLKEAESVKRRLGMQASAIFRAVATGRLTPLMHHVEGWLAEGHDGKLFARGTRCNYRGSVQTLARWAEGIGELATVEAFTDELVARFIADGDLTDAPFRRSICAASAFWRWMVEHGIVESNPWPEPGAGPMARNGCAWKPARPVTDEEMDAFRTGYSRSQMREARAVATRLGARLDATEPLLIDDHFGY